MQHQTENKGYSNSIIASVISVIVIYFLFPSYSFLSLIAILITLFHVFALLFCSFTEIPFRILFGLIMSIQLLLSPALVYNGLEEYQYYKMEISEQDYFLYTIPAILSFLCGIYINRKKYGEGIDFDGIAITVKEYSFVPYTLIIIGFLSSYLSSLFSSQLSFIFYLLASFKFVGLFLLILSKQNIKTSLLIIIYGAVVISSLQEGMFHDLILWVILLFLVLEIRFKFKVYQKFLGLFGAIILILAIQIVKSEFRARVWSGNSGNDVGVATIVSSVNSVESKNGSFFNGENLASQLSRFNQGWIIASTMNNVPAHVPFANGSTLVQYAEAALLPRFLDPDKLTSSDQTIFNTYSGHTITGYTAMALGSLGDAYANFGELGGIVFMFIYGYLYNYVLLFLKKYSYKYPSLMVFSVVIFFYPIRVECDLSTILGHLVKSSFLIWVIFKFFGEYFRIPDQHKLV